MSEVVSKDKKKKKNKAQLVIRLDEELRSDFIDACQQMDTSASREIRRFMKKYLKQFKAGELDE